MVKFNSQKTKQRKLVVVFDRESNSEVKARRNVRRVPLNVYCFPVVRRNKKIQLVQRMCKAETDKHVGVQIVVSKRGKLSEAKCIYGEQVIEVLEHPHDFVYKRDKTIKGIKVYNVMKDDSSSSVIMQTDLTKNDLTLTCKEVERDIGVLKSSVNQLLEQKGNDVVAINTHPGHHAGPTRVAGFCTINNIAVAVGLIRRERPRIKLGVIDIDIHPGDGTQQFVERHQGLVNKYVSIHSAAQFYNMEHPLGANGIALKLDNKREVCSQRLIGKIDEVLNSWNRDHLNIVIVALGFDTLKYDPVANLGFQMRPAHFHAVGKVFANRPEQILFIQEGGYDLNETATAFDYLIKGFREGRKSQMNGEPKA